MFRQILLRHLLFSMLIMKSSLGDAPDFDHNQSHDAKHVSQKFTDHHPSQPIHNHASGELDIVVQISILMAFVISSHVLFVVVNDAKTSAMLS